MAPSQEYLDAYGAGNVVEQGFEAAAVDAVGKPVRHHVHHTYIWLGTLRVAFWIFIAVLISLGSSIAEMISETGFISRHNSMALTAIIAGAVALFAIFFIVMVVYMKISYKHLYFTIEPSEFSLYKGILNKQRVHVPYTRVQSVDQKASLIQRVLGVCTVQIDTAGGASNKAISIPYVTKAQAIWLRSELFLRKQAAVEGVDVEQLRAISSIPSAPAATGAIVGAGADASTGANAQAVNIDNVLEVGNQVWNEFGNGLFSGTAHEDGKVTCEYGLTNKELVLTGLSNNTGFVAVIFMVIAVVLQVFTAVFQVFPEGGEWIVDSVNRGTQALSFAGAVAAVVAIVVILLVVWAFSIIGTLISFGGFRARRRGTRIEVERGLLQHVYTGVDIDRVQSVVIKQTFIRRLIGYCELSLSKIDAASSEDESQNKNLNQTGLVIHPFLKVARVPEVLSGIAPEYDGAPKDIKPVAKVALRRALIRRCIWQGGGFWLAVITAIAQAVLNIAWLYDEPIDIDIVDPVLMLLYALAAILFVIDAINAVLWARESGFSHNRDFIRILNGGFGRTTCDVPRRKIQYASTQTNPLQRLAHTATVNVRTAAGIGGTTVKLIDAWVEDAEECLEWVKPRR